MLTEFIWLWNVYVCVSPFPVTFCILKELMAQIKSHLKIILKRNFFFKKLWSHQSNANFHWLWYINYGKTERQVFQKKARRCGTIVLKEAGSAWMIPVSCKCSSWVGLVNVWISFSKWAPAPEPPSPSGWSKLLRCCCHICLWADELEERESCC